MGQLCADWEEAATSSEQLGVRVAINRIGLILSDKGGVLDVIRGPIEKRFTTVFGNGSQIYPWIHIDDLCGMIMLEAENPALRGAFNAAAPNAISQREMNSAVATQMGRSAITLPIPRFVLNAAMGERAGVLMNGYHMSSGKIQAAGHNFQFKTIQQAMADLI